MYVVGDHAESSAVVCLDRCGGSLVPHLFPELSHGYRFAGVDVESTEFGLGGTGHDRFEDFGDVEDGAVVWWVVNVRQADELVAIPRGNAV